MHSRLIAFVIALIALIISACGMDVSSTNPSSPQPFVITVTLPPTLTPRPSDTPLPPTATATVAPIEGTTKTQLNVRAEPNTASTALGMIGPFAKVQVTGKDPSGNWYQIIYPQESDSNGWLTATYVQVSSQTQIPVIGAVAGVGSAPSGLVVQPLNVRSGPGTNYNSIGVLNPNDVVYLTGKNDTGAWLQIAFAGAPDGKGWVTASFIKADGLENLPIIAETGKVVGTGTPTGIPPTVTPTLIPASRDGDSAQSPAADVVFSANGTRAFIYSDSVSSGAGDNEDWVQFTPYQPNILIQLDCTVNGSMTLELTENDHRLTETVSCNQSRIFSLSVGNVYLAHLRAAEQSSLQYTGYTLKVENIQ